MSNDICLLCGTSAPLQASHIIPAFAYDWLKETSASPFLRSNHPNEGFGLSPQRNHFNKRVQDGPTRTWFCDVCEDILGRDESTFAREFFYPFFQNPSGSFSYGRWMLRFCTSVSWRVLKHYQEAGLLADWDTESIELVTKAETNWRDFLLDKRDHIRPTRQHLFPVYGMIHSNPPMPANINSYIMRSITMDLVEYDDASQPNHRIYTLTKIGPFMIGGFIREAQSPQHRWSGTFISAKSGRIEPRSIRLPGSFREYIVDKARSTSNAFDGISDTQKAKIEAAAISDPDRFFDSATYEAFVFDQILASDSPHTNEDVVQ